MKHWWAVVVTALIGLGVIIYIIPQTRNIAYNLIYFSQCDTPIKYKLGSIDPRFGLTSSQAAVDVSEAENIWELPVGKNLFQNSSDAELTINFVYDQRQALSTKVNELNNEVSQKNADLKAKIDQYKKDSADFESRLNNFVNTVNKYNKEGGAPEEVYNELTKTQDQLKTEADSLNQRAGDLNLSTRNYNTEVGALNQNISQFNNVLNQKPEEGLYDGNQNTITIYFADKKDELIHTLAHELGHSFGADHVSGRDAIMYPYTTSVRSVTNQDLAQLTKVCKKKPRIMNWLYVFDKWIYTTADHIFTRFSS